MASQVTMDEAVNGGNKNQQMTVHVIHAKEKYTVSLDATQGPPTVEQFASRVADLTKIPVIRQRLLYKGKSLTNMSAPLTSYGLKTGDKVMVLGSKVVVEDDTNGLTMNTINQNVTTNSDRLEELLQQFSSIQTGSPLAVQHQETLTRLDRQLGICIEVFTRQLEELDALSLAASSNDMRDKRKSIVRRIQLLLDRADGLHNKIVEVMNNSEGPTSSHF